MTIAILRLLTHICLALSLMTATTAQTRYRLSVDPWIAWAPAVVAEKLGMWQRHGIEVEVVIYAASDNQVQFRAGRNDFAMVMAGTAVGLQVQHGIEVTVLAEIDWSQGGDKFLVRDGIDLAAAHGQRIAVYEDTPAVALFLDAGLRARGLRLADYEIVELTDLGALASQFLARRVVAAVTYEPYSTVLTQQGVCRTIATTADFPGIMPECIVAHSRRLASVPVQDVAALLEGWMDAVAWVAEPKNAEQFARICIADFFIDEQPKPEQIPAMLANVRIHDPATLRARNLGDDGIRRYLDECNAFARSRYCARPDVAEQMRLDTRGLALALERAAQAAAAAPAK